MPEGPERGAVSSVVREGARETAVTDQELVRLANSGDASAFERIYVRHRDWAVRLAWRFSRDREDALDVMQDAFAYLFGKFPGFELRAKMTTFLYPVVRNLALERARKRRRTVPIADADSAEPEAPAGPQPADAREGRARLAEALRKLNEGEREVVHLRFTEDMKLGEIARALAVPLGTVKSRLHSALSRLRKALGRP
jgi:RNA polymerase sigma-70 factor (ECF subfamily)